MEYWSPAAFENMERGFRRNFFNCLSGFKSVNLCGTADSKGNHNLSLISSVVHIGANPPLMGMVIRPASVPRNTLENILETGEFTFNHISGSMVRMAHQTAARYDKGISEFDETGLTPIVEGTVNAPYVKESPVRIGLKSREMIDIKSNGTILVVGEVAEVFTLDGVVGNDGYIDIQSAGTVTVAGLDGYHSVIKIVRLSHPKPGKGLEELSWE